MCQSAIKYGFAGYGTKPLGLEASFVQRYMVKSAYNNLTAADVEFNVDGNHVLWLKVIPLKVNIFILRVLLNWIATIDNLFRRNIIVASNIHCSIDCNCLEDRDRLFFKCDFYGPLELYFKMVRFCFGSSKEFI